MTRKDYVLIAAALKRAREYGIDHERSTAPDETLDAACFALEHALAQDNPRFDRARFLKACGVQS